ncbi:Appr-1-p processing protein [Prosthecobacter sp.]|uniref:Appr-1-p processing protein n=1 Tax=Prosthecobacter sp. TaxID=1965333 RepID=UPI00378415A3
MSQFVPVQYIVGDATQPDAIGQVIVAHVCNDTGGWGAGFVLALSKRWKQPEQQYRQWRHDGAAGSAPFALGEVQFVRVGENITVANMIGQHGIRRIAGQPPIRYAAIDQALIRVAEEASRQNAGVHMPRIGCGLAGGSWDEIEPLIFSRLSSRGIPVTIYDLTA